MLSLFTKNESNTIHKPKRTTRHIFYIVLTSLWTTDVFINPFITYNHNHHLWTIIPFSLLAILAGNSWYCESKEYKKKLQDYNEQLNKEKINKEKNDNITTIDNQPTIKIETQIASEQKTTEQPNLTLTKLYLKK